MGLLRKELFLKWSNQDWTETSVLDNCRSVSNEKIIAIGGCARSGTTVVRAMLDSHSDLMVGPPTNVFIPIPLDPSDIAFRLLLDEPKIAQLVASSARDRVRFIEALACEAKSLYQKKIWGDKTARNVHRFKWILDHFPRARVIHVVRDGRDVVCSLTTHRRRKVVGGALLPVRSHMPLELCLDRWIRSVQDGISVRGNAHYYEICYEKLIDDPESTLKNLCDFLNIDFDPRMIAFHEISGPLRDPIRFPQNLEATLPLYSSAVGRWRKDLSEVEQVKVGSALNPLLTSLGYILP